MGIIEMSPESSRAEYPFEKPIHIWEKQKISNYLQMVIS